jgi:hypothetical protein
LTLLGFGALVIDLLMQMGIAGMIMTKKIAVVLL